MCNITTSGALVLVLKLEFVVVLLKRFCDPLIVIDGLPLSGVNLSSISET
jgi:hypothetical protein